MIVTLLDTETTDLIQNGSVKLDKQPEVIEFYSRTVDLRDGKLHHEYETLIKPKKPVSAKITKITGINNEMLENQPAFDDVNALVQAAILPELLDLWPDVSHEVPPVIAHNASFDMEVLSFEYQRLNKVLKIPRVICTVEATTHFKGFRLGLNALHECLFGEPFKDHHRARNDVMALQRICIELFKRGEL